MLTPEQVEQFHHNGFLLGPKVLTDEQVTILQHEIMRVIADEKNTSVPRPVMLHNMNRGGVGTIWQIVNICDASKPFMDLVRNRAIVEATVQLTKARELRLWHDQIQYKPASEGGVNMWHQDSPLWPSLTPKDQQMTAWVALDDVDSDNGCMSMVPDSHLWGDHMSALRGVKDYNALPTNFHGHTVEIKRTPVKKGHVHFHHPLTWHGSHANSSGRERRAIALHYMNDKTLFEPNSEHPMKPFISSHPGTKVEGERFAMVWG